MVPTSDIFIMPDITSRLRAVRTFRGPNSVIESMDAGKVPFQLKSRLYSWLGTLSASIYTYFLIGFDLSALQHPVRVKCLKTTSAVLNIVYNTNKTAKIVQIWTLCRLCYCLTIHGTWFRKQIKGLIHAVYVESVYILYAKRIEE